MYSDYIVTQNITENGAKHSKFTYLKDIKKKVPKTFEQVIINSNKKSHNYSNYIDKRCINLQGKSVYYAVNEYYYINSKNIKKKYKIRDLIYDIKIGRITV